VVASEAHFYTKGFAAPARKNDERLILQLVKNTTKRQREFSLRILRKPSIYFVASKGRQLMADEKKNEAMSDDELDQIIQDMSKEDEQATAEPVEAPVAAFPAEEEEPVREEPVRVLRAAKPEYAAPAASDQSLKMELQGVVNLKVNFSSGGRSIELVCSEDALVCRMADGTEFRIPLNQAGGAKRNAA
jgi:hypothetical protein